MRSSVTQMVMNDYQWLSAILSVDTLGGRYFCMKPRIFIIVLKSITN